MCSKNLLKGAQIFYERSRFSSDFLKFSSNKNNFLIIFRTKHNFPAKYTSSIIHPSTITSSTSRNYKIYNICKFDDPQELLRESKRLCNVYKFNLPKYSTAPKTGKLVDDVLLSKSAGNSKIDNISSDKEKEKDKWYSGKNAWKVGLATLAVGGFFACTSIILTFGQPQKGQDGKEVIDEFSKLPGWLAYPKRALREVYTFKKMIEDPSSEKLLPDPLKDPWYQPPYTLVIEMTGVLVHPDWTLSTGWRFKKRPGLKYFLQQIGPPLFEVVIYTHEQGFTAYPIIDSMDPDGRIMFRLFRDATKYVDGTHVKDLSFLNRDLSKVIIVDCDPKAMSLQPRNGFLLQKWEGDDADRKLVDLANFLKTIALSGVEDVRPVMEHYAQFDDPIAVFKEKQKQLQSMEDEKVKQEAAKKQKSSLLSNFTQRLR